MQGSSNPVPERLLSLDLLRGITVAAMILVTDPGTYSAVYPPLLHAAWNGPTATDMIFPCFLVLVGVSMTLSFSARLARGTARRTLLLHALRRTVVLILLGLIVNGFPDYHLATLRFPGVLQRIGICYSFAALLWLAISRFSSVRRRQAMVIAALVGCLAGYWLLLKVYPTPGFGAGRLDSLGSLPAVVDRAVFGVQHLWFYGTTPGYGVTFDPEGLLSTIPAFATLLFGVLAGEELLNGRKRSQQAVLLTAAGAVLVVLGLALSPWLPLNKKIWTSTFACLSGGVSLLLLAASVFAVDVPGRQRGWTLARIFGTNAILAYVLSSLVTTAGDRLHIAEGGHAVSLHAFVAQHAFAAWLPPRPASLAYAMAVVLFDAALLYPLYRKRTFVRI